MSWLQGGPYYELSFLILNSPEKKRFLQELISNLGQLTAIDWVPDKEALEKIIDDYVVGAEDDGMIYRMIDIHAFISVSGKRKARVFVAELSDEFVKVNFWFFGSIYDVAEWNQAGIRKEDKPAFRDFFHVVRELFNPIAGTIGYEEDCQELFDTTHAFPHPSYSSSHLTLEHIRTLIANETNPFEYAWLNGATFGLQEDLEFDLGYQ